MRAAPTSRSLLNPARWLIGFRALLRRWVRAGCAPLRPGAAWRRGRRGGRQRATLAGVERFHPQLVQFEDRFYPGDPTGLQYAALWGAGAGLLLPSMAITASVGDPGLPAAGDVSGAASALAFAAPDQPAAGGSNIAQADVAPGSTPDAGTPALTTTATTQPSGAEPWADPLGPALAAALATTPVTAPAGPAAPSPGAASGGTSGAAAVFSPTSGSLSAASPALGTSSPASPPQQPSPTPPSAPAGGPARGTSPLSASPASAAAASAPLVAGAPPAASVAGQPASPTPAVAGHPSLDQAFAHVPLAFEPNVGQVSGANADQVQYLSHGPGYSLFLTGNAAVLSLARPGSPGVSDVVKEQFVGASPSPQVAAGQELASRSNYFTGSDPSAWHTDVPQYGQVTYQNLYPGVDARYYGNGQGQLEYDLTVAPGADPAAIRMQVQGATGLQLDGQGNLLVQTGGGTVLQQVPVLYQVRDGVKQAVTGKYTLGSDGSVGFQPGAYDPTLPLVIDPTLNFAGYLGGSGADYAYGVAVDAAGNVYVTGQTASTNFPVTTGATLGQPTDGFVSKFYASGSSLIYSTYLGGGNGADSGNAIAVDPGGNAYVAGQTASSSFPTTSSAYQTSGPSPGGNLGFFSKLNVTGDALLYSTYFGSTHLSAQGAGTGVAVDAAGNAYVTGYTSTATGFPTSSGAYQTTGGGGYDAWVAKFNPHASGSSSLVYSTLLGGSADDKGLGIAIDPSGDAYVTGSTGNPSGTGFPTTSGAYQTTFGSGTTKGFVTEVNPTGTSLIYSTLLGGTGTDQGNALAVNLSGNAYVTGTASSTNFPTTTGAYQTTSGGGNDAFVTELNTTGTGLVYSTYLGGSGNDEGYGLAVDGSGDAFVAGETASSNFPTASALQSSNGGGNDAFLSEINPSGASLVDSTYLGGTSDDAARAVALDLAGNAYVAGWTNSSNFPTAGNPYQSSSGGSTDAFLAKIGAVPNPPVFTAISPDTGSSSSDQITTSQNLTLSGTAAKSATVTVSRSGVGVLGSVTANATTGVWSYDYSGTTLPEGTYAFTGTTTVSGLTSPPSPPFLVTVDRTAPALTLTVPASTASKKPQVLVAASDLNGLPDGTTVSIDVDTNNDGNFTDSGESGYATGTLKDGSVLITLPTLPGTGSYPVRARVTDLAGNQGTSSTQDIVVSSVTAWSIASAAVLTSDPLTGDSQDQLGDVPVSAPLDLDQSPGTSQSGDPALVYNSDSVTGAPVLQVAMQAPNNAALPSSLQAQLTWNGVQQSAVTFNVPSAAGPGSVLVLGLQVPAVSSTGRDGWSVTVTPSGGSGMTTSGSTFVVLQTGSSFGSGWTLSNMDQLVSIAADSYGPAGMLRAYGTGEWRFYASAGGGSYTSPAGDNGTLSSSGGAYTYTIPDGQTWNFNSSGQETSWVSPDGHETLAFSYSSGQLSTLTAIDGASTTFSYSGSLVSTIQTGSRTVTLTYSGTDLTQVTNPDGGAHTFGYATGHLLDSDQLGGVQDSWSYASINTLATYTWGGLSGVQQSPSVTGYNPALLTGLPSGPTPVAAVGPAQASATDALGHTTLWQFDAQGRPLQETQPNGGVWTWARDSNGRVTVQTDPLHRVTTIAYDSSGYPTQVTQPDGSTLGYQYQSSFHALTQATDERGHITTFTYDSQGHELTMVNALNQTTTFGWTTGGLLQTVTDPLGHTTTLQYDSSRRLTQTTDPLNNATQFSYDGNGNPQTTTDALSRVTTTAYDAMSRLTVQTDALGHSVTMTYDAAGLLLTATDPLGHVTSVTYDSFSRGLPYLQRDATGTPAQAIRVYTYDADGRLSTPRDTNGYTTSKGYDARGNLIQVTNPMGGVQKAAYDLAGQQTGTRDELGRWTFYQYNSRGWVTAVTDPLGNTTTYAYDQAGDLTSVTDPLNHTVTYQYDALNRQTVQTDALGHSLTTTYDAAGNVSTVTDALGHVTSYTYDAANELVTETDAVGTSLQRTSTLAYDAVGNVTAATDPLGHTTDYAYDQLNRPTAVTDPLSHTTTLSYDAAGNLTSSQDALGKTTDYAYDAQNRPVAVTDPLGHTVTTAYDAMGNAVAVTDALGHTTVTGYDPLQDPLVTADALGGVTRVVYDASGNPVSVTDPVGNQTGFVYDGLNRVVSATNPLGYATTVAYDAAGRETSTTDADGRVQNFTYDAANRLTGGTWVTSGSTVNTLTYSYDANNNLLTAGDTTGTYTLTYDALDRLATDQNLYGLTLTYSYDAADRVTQVQDPLGGVTTSVYDAANRLTTREFGGTGQTPLRVDLSYDNRNDLTGVTRYSDLAGTQVVGTTSYSYDDASRVTAIVNKNASSATLSYYDYSYDAADRVTSQTWQSGSTPGSATYTYDATDQLLSDGTHTYSYDLNGNRTMSGYQTGTDNRLTTDGVWTYTYDNAGNEIEKSKGAGLETWYYTYDTLNRLTDVRQTSDGSTNEMVATYTYDVFGDRVQQSEWTSGTGTVTTRFQYDAKGNVWADTDTSNNVQVRYLYGDGVDQLFARTEASGQANPGVAWYLTDALGSVRDLMDSTGTLRDHLDYDGFGNQTESNVSFGDRYKYTGREYDSNTGLQYNRARYFDPKTGRWITNDPRGFGAGDTNLGRYVRNDPQNAIDPSGCDETSVVDVNGIPEGETFEDEYLYDMANKEENEALRKQTIDAANAMTSWKKNDKITIKVWYIPNEEEGPKQFFLHAIKKASAGSINIAIVHGGENVSLFDMKDLEKEYLEKYKDNPPQFGIGSCLATLFNSSISEKYRLPVTPTNNGNIMGFESWRYYAPMIIKANELIKEKIKNLKKGEKVVVNLYFGGWGGRTIDQNPRTGKQSYLPRGVLYKDWKPITPGKGK
jgi:RHS repeat-associated protein